MKQNLTEAAGEFSASDPGESAAHPSTLKNQSISSSPQTFYSI